MNDTIDKLTPAEAGISIKIISGPTGGVDKEKGSNGESTAWPHIAYEVELSHNGRAFFTGPYKLGVGHVKPTDEDANRCANAELGAFVRAWIHKPHANFIDKQKQADAAAYLAKLQAVTPKLDDVMHSLLMDGAAYFDGAAFEDWCGDYGYDSDSRKAESIWRACDDTGRKLLRALGQETTDRLREWASNY